MDVLWYLLYPLLLAAPFGVAVAIGAYEGRLIDAKWKKFSAMLREGGFELRAGATRDQWSAGGQWDGLPLSVEVFSVQEGKSSSKYLGIRLLEAVGWSDAVVHPAAAVPVGELGAMREVPVDAQLGARYRVFGTRPDEVQRWLGRGAQTLLQELSARRLEIKGGAVLLVLPVAVSEAFDVLRSAELLAAIHRGREARSDAMGAPLRVNWTTPWTVAAAVPLAVAFVGALVLPMIPGVPSLASPLVCDKGELRMVWSSSGGGRSSGNMYCVTREGRDGQFLRPFLLGFNALSWPATAALALRALLKRREPYGVRTLARAPAVGYRHKA